MNKVVINVCYGGFSLSKEASEILRDQGVDTDPCSGYLPDDVPRHDKRLVEVVEKLGDKANGSCARLKVVGIYEPAYKIVDHDGWESLEWLDGDWIFIK